MLSREKNCRTTLRERPTAETVQIDRRRNNKSVFENSTQESGPNQNPSKPKDDFVDINNALKHMHARRDDYWT